MSDETITLRVETPTHGRVLLRPSSSSPAPLLVGFHGYAENAAVNLEALSAIPGAFGWHLASIQGLHRFYNPRTGEVIASWMTKEDRELAVADNRGYVAAALEEVAARVDVAGPRVAVGFSQGTAMTYRAAAHASPPFDGIVALAGDVPNELAQVEWSGSPRVLIGRGDGEEWYSPEKLAADRDLLAGRGLAVEVCEFAGGHEWTDEFYDACGRFLAELAAEEGA